MISSIFSALINPSPVISSVYNHNALLLVKVYFPGAYFLKVYFLKVYLPKVYFTKVDFQNRAL